MNITLQIVGKQKKDSRLSLKAGLNVRHSKRFATDSGRNTDFEQIYIN